LNSTPQNSAPAAKWLSLADLYRQFQANLAALGQRDSELAAAVEQLKPAAEYFISPAADRVMLGAKSAAGVITPLPNPVPPAYAREIAAKLYPQAQYNQPLLVAGLDQGWIWEAVYKLNCVCPTAPGWRPPLFLMSATLERLWGVLHFQNWATLLADPRVQIFAGPDAPAQLKRRLVAQPRLAPPRLAVTAEPQLWQSGQNLDVLLGSVSAELTAKLRLVQDESAKWQGNWNPDEAGAKFREGRLRILGITSRYTTFLQHSMRDWLAAMEKLGHQTRLVIEDADHELLPAVEHAEICREFKPDLILIIDHYRAEVPTLPDKIPCVMWIQDRLPNIFSAKAGASQGRTDFVIGYGRSECAILLGYPSRRHMPCMVGVNEDRFAARAANDAELEKYRCDVSFVSHASATAEQIVEEEGGRAPQLRPLLQNICRRLRGIYDSGQAVTEQAHVWDLVGAAMSECKMNGDFADVVHMVKQRMNNALLRHQAIGWVAKMGLDLRLYGKGWEKHPQFARYARGVADNQNQLAQIYQASRINLQVMPFGSAHQRSFEGLAAGGFFLLRGVAGDAADLVKQQLWGWCLRHGVNSSEEMMLRGREDVDFIPLFSKLTQLMGTIDPPWLYAAMEEMAMGGFCHSAAQLWPEYDRVVFWTEAELQAKVKHFLAAADERRGLSASMRQRVLQRHTYTAISRRMLNFIAADLGGVGALSVAA